VKIIKNNNYIEIVCEHCKSELGIVLSDIRWFEFTGPPTVTCKACDNRTTVLESILPSSWRSAIFADCD
jgi:hypothetical protein